VLDFELTPFFVHDPGAAVRVHELLDLRLRLLQRHPVSAAFLSPLLILDLLPCVVSIQHLLFPMKSVELGGPVCPMHQWIFAVPLRLLPQIVESARSAC
jgi:hypothetical protein